MTMDIRMPYDSNTGTINPRTYTEGGADFDEPIWDRIPISSVAGNEEREMFTIPVGQVDPVSGVAKTIVDTSIRSQGVRKNEAYRIFGFALKYQPVETRTVAEIQSINRVFSECLFEFFINSRNQYGICVLDFIMGDPLPVVASLAAGDNFNFSSFGRKVGYWPLNLTIPLANLTDFAIKLTWKTLPSSDLNDDLLKIELVGIKTRLALS